MVGCDVCTDIPDLERSLLSEDSIVFVRKYIPNGKILQCCGDGSDVSLVISKSNKQSVVEDYPSFQVQGPEIDSKDVLALSEYLMERARQEKRVYNLHSSTVNRDDSCVIIHGASRSGKTAIALYGMLSGDIEFLTNERTLIDLKRKRVVGGCRLLDVQKYHHEMFPQIGSIGALNLGDFPDREFEVRAIVYPSIDTGLKQLIIEERDMASAEWLLYPEFTSRIRGVNRRMFNLTYPLDSLDTKDLSRRRLADLDTFLVDVPFYFVRGEVEDILGFIVSQL